MSNFSEIINGSTPVLVDFFAEWCQPCKMMSPVLKDLKIELGNELTILKINVDKNQQLSAQYNIKGVPTFMLFKESEMLWRQSGMLSKQDFISIINKHK